MVKRKTSGCDSQNPLFNSDSDDNEVIDASQEEATASRLYTLDAITPVAKRAKCDQDPAEQNPRKLNYDSDELTQRHSPAGSDSSPPGSPVFFDLDDDDDPVPVPEPPAQTCKTLDMSVDSPLMKNLRQLGSQLRQSQEGGDTSFVVGGPIPAGAEMGFRTAANKSIQWATKLKDQEEQEASSPDDEYYHEPSFKFGGEIPSGAEMGFRTAANMPIDFVPIKDCLDIFKDSQDEGAKEDLFGQFADSQMNDDLLHNVANGEYLWGLLVLIEIIIGIFTSRAFLKLSRLDWNFITR